MAEYLGALETPKPALLMLVGAQVLFFFQLASGPLAARAARREDPISGLGNRLALLHDLERCYRHGSASVLALCELHGFDGLVRSDGRDARERALDAAAIALEERFGEWASAYRGEGGDFWVLAPRRHVPDPEALAADAAATLAAAGMPLSTATVLVPEEAPGAGEAWRLAESRLPAPASP